MSRYSGLLICIVLSPIIEAQPVFLEEPDWESLGSGYGTGAALADIDRDGLLDLVVSHGNDMTPGTLRVFLNDSGSLPEHANWESADEQFNGHLDVSDVDGDGWPDVAVSHLGDGTTRRPVARVYMNHDGVLEAEASWQADWTGQAFSCAFGDMNGDGRPDLAVGTGWAYDPPQAYPNLVYLNEDGMLSDTPAWTSSDYDTMQGVHWVDADGDGWLDLIAIGQGSETRVYRNLGGMLDTSPTWMTADSASQDGIMVATGDVNGDGFLDLLATDNTQLNGSGKFKHYPGLPGGFFESTYSWSFFEGYGSAVCLGDVNGDHRPDLLTGGWWSPARLFLSRPSGLPENPDWVSCTGSVIEKITLGQLNPPCEIERRDHQVILPEGQKKLFYLAHQPISRVIRVDLDGVELAPHQYTFSRDSGWIALATAPAHRLQVTTTWSPYPDMAISNWDWSKGNYVFFNQLFSDCNDNAMEDECEIAYGLLMDVNHNGLPDDCECLCDCAQPRDARVDEHDLQAAVDTWGYAQVPCAVTEDGTVDVLDLALILSQWGPCGP